MLEDLRDRCGVRLPLPQGIPVAGPFETMEDPAMTRKSTLVPMLSWRWTKWQPMIRVAAAATSSTSRLSRGLMLRLPLQVRRHGPVLVARQ